MAFNIKAAKLSGNPDSSGWSQLYEFLPEDPEKLAKRGRLFAIISTASQGEGLDTVVAGREILSRLHEEYFGRLEDKPYDALKNALEKVVGEFSSWDGIEIAAVSEVGASVYAAAGGGSSVYIFRQGKLYKLIESGADKILGASGNPSDGDQIIIGSGAFFSSFSSGTIKGFLQSGNPEDITEAFAPLVHSKDSEGRIGLFILCFEKSLEKEITDSVPDGVIEKDIPKEEKPSFTLQKQADFKGRVKNIFAKIGEKRIYLKSTASEQSRQREKKTSFLVGILLLSILSVSIFFGIQQKKKSDFKLTYQEQLVSAEHELQESYNLMLLNPQRSRELFNQARSKVLGMSKEEIEDPALETLKGKIKEGEEKILGQYTGGALTFVDLALYSEGFKGSDISGDSGDLYILDKGSGKIVKVGMSDKRTEMFAGPADVRGANLLAVYSGRVFVSTSEGLYELDNGRIEISEIESGDVLIAAYAGNLYLLDKKTSEINRYPALDAGFGSAKEWLREDLEVNFSAADKMVIDGSVWVLAGDKDILKFSLGNLQEFGFEGVFPEITNINDIFSDDESGFLYVFEKEKGRVVVSTKDGEYKAQYLIGNAGDAEKIIVSEKEKRAFRLTPYKLLYIDLKHLD